MRYKYIIIFIFILAIALFSFKYGDKLQFSNLLKPPQRHTDSFPKMSLNNSQAQLLIDDSNFLKSSVEKYGPSQVVERVEQLMDSKNQDCHLMAHQIGRVTYSVFGDQSFKLCSSLCHSGCYHGATEAYFKEKGTANLQQNLQTLCQDERNGFYTHQCLHGVGHGLMAWSNYQLLYALRSCDELKSYNNQASCWTGVFMENIVGALAEGIPNSGKTAQSVILDSEKHYTSYLNNDPQYPCTIVPEKYKDTCYFLQPTRMLQLFKGNFEKVAKACLDAPVQNQRSCFQSMGREVNGNSNHHVEEAIKLCQYVPYGEDRNNCLIGAVQDTFWDPSGQSEALSFCAKLTDSKEISDCYSTIIGRAGQVLDKSGLAGFCVKVPQLLQQNCNKING